jgi:hypothetical protein
MLYVGANSRQRLSFKQGINMAFASFDGHFAHQSTD